MYTPYYNYVPQKKKGIEELYKTEEKTEIKAEPDGASAEKTERYPRRIFFAFQ